MVLVFAEADRCQGKVRYRPVHHRPWPPVGDGVHIWIWDSQRHRRWRPSPPTTCQRATGGPIPLTRKTQSGMVCPSNIPSLDRIWHFARSCCIAQTCMADRLLKHIPWSLRRLPVYTKTARHPIPFLGQSGPFVPLTCEARLWGLVLPGHPRSEARRGEATCVLARQDAVMLVATR